MKSCVAFIDSTEVAFLRTITKEQILDFYQVPNNLPYISVNLSRDRVNV